MHDVANASIKVDSAVKLTEESDESIEGVVVSYSEIVGFMHEISVLDAELNETANDEKATLDEITNKIEAIESVCQRSHEHLNNLKHISDEISQVAITLQKLA